MIPAPLLNITAPRCVVQVSVSAGKREAAAGRGSSLTSAIEGNRDLDGSVNSGLGSY